MGKEIAKVNGKIVIVVEMDKKDQLLISVIDQGQGIKKCNQGMLFKMLESIKNNININGIGLSICKQIVNKFDG